MSGKCEMHLDESYKLLELYLCQSLRGLPQEDFDEIPFDCEECVKKIVEITKEMMEKNITQTERNGMLIGLRAKQVEVLQKALENSGITAIQLSINFDKMCAFPKMLNETQNHADFLAKTWDWYQISITCIPAELRRTLRDLKICDNLDAIN